MPGVASVVVQVLTGDSTAALERLGSVTTSTADRMGASFQKAGAVMGDSFEVAASKAVAASKEMEAATARVVKAQKALIDLQAKGSAVPPSLATHLKAAQAEEASIKKQIEAQAKLDAAKAKVGGTMSKLGGAALLGLSAATVAVGVEAVKMGIDYETAQKKIQGVTGQSEASAKKLTSAFQNTHGMMQSGLELEQSYAKVAGQLQITEHHALSNAQALQYMTAAGKLQGATGEQLGAVTKSLASVMQVFDLRTGEASHTTDKLFNASRATSVSIETIAATVTKLHGRLGDLGGGLSSVLGLMSEAAAKGLTGGRGVLIFNQALERLTSGSKATTSVLEALGVHIHTASGAFVGMPSVIDQLHHAYERLNPAERQFATQQLLGKGATGEFSAIIQTGSKELARFTQHAEQSGTVQEANKLAAESLAGKMKVLLAEVKNLGGALGEALIPKLTALAHGLIEGTEWFKKHAAAAAILAGVITTVLGAAIGAFVGSKIALLVNGVKVAASAMAGLAGSFAADGTAIVASADETAVGVDAALVGTGAGAIVVAIGGLILAGVELKEHWAEVMHALESAASSAANYVIDRLNEIIHAVNKTTGVLTLGLAPAIGEIGKTTGPGATAGPGLGGVKVVGPNGEEQSLGSFGANSSAAGRSVASLENLGLSLTAAQGVVKAMQGETQGNLEKGAAEENKTEGAYGIAQWVGPRRAGLEKFAKGKHKDKSNLEVQLEYLAYELQHGELGSGKIGSESAASFFKRLQSAHGIGEATGIFVKQFERPTSAGPVEERAGGFKPEGALAGLMETTAHGKPKKSKKQKEEEATVNPFGQAHGLTQTREDMGLDFSMTPGSRIVAPGTGVIDKIIANWYEHQPLIEELITKGKDKGKHFYVAEQINKAVTEGQHVKVGQLLGTFASSGTGVEAGLGAGAGTTLAQSRGEFHDHPGNDPTRASSEFKTFLKGLGKGGEGLESGGAISAFEKATKAFESITKSGTNLYKKYETDLQSGGIKVLEKLLGTSATDRTGAHSVQAGELRTLIASLKAGGMGELAAKLVKVHKEALALLVQEVKDAAVNKEAEKLGIESKHLANLTADARSVNDKELQVKKDEVDQNIHSMEAGSRALTDAADEMKSRVDIAVIALTDATQQMADAFSGQTQAIKDASDTKVAELEERGKYGLDAQAQREQVALDKMKEQYDAQIQASKIGLDQLKTQEDHLVATKQLGVTTTTARQNALVAAAQAKDDAARVDQDNKILIATEVLGHVQSKVDNTTGNDLLKQVALALTGGSKGEQTHWAEKLKADEKRGEYELTQASGVLGGVENTANTVMQAADQNLAKVTETANAAIAAAQAQLKEAEGQSAQVIAMAEQNLKKVEGEAEVHEAEAEAKINQTKAESTTQYAGSGLVVNFTNIPTSDSQAIMSELGWFARTKLPA